MWSPSYYEQWTQRVTAVNSLRSRDDEKAYARANGINYIVDVCVNQDQVEATFSTKHLCVFKVRGS
jgi:hypothetical protein